MGSVNEYWFPVREGKKPDHIQHDDLVEVLFTDGVRMRQQACRFNWVGVVAFQKIERLGAA